MGYQLCISHIPWLELSNSELVISLFQKAKNKQTQKQKIEKKQYKKCEY